uniref:Peptidase U32 n=1 Tax=Anisakis simplex TaxID=6269 RepID=A0A0M3KEU4_ANISI
LVRQWKGADHPVNRFNWRLKEKRGELDEDLLRKKDVVGDLGSLGRDLRLEIRSPGKETAQVIDTGLWIPILRNNNVEIGFNSPCLMHNIDQLGYRTTLVVEVVTGNEPFLEVFD